MSVESSTADPLIGGDSGTSIAAYRERLEQLAKVPTFWGLSAEKKRMIEAWAPRFLRAVKTGFRVALSMLLTGVTVWVMRSYELVPDIYIGKLPSVVVAIVLNVAGDFATTFKGCVHAAFGTFLATAVSFFVFMIPNANGSAPSIYAPSCPVWGSAVTQGAKDDLMHWYCETTPGLATADDVGITLPGIIAFVVFAAFTFGVMSLNVTLSFKQFALLTALSQLMSYADPKIDVSNYMDLTWESELVSSLVMQFVGSFVACLTMAIPPITARRSSVVAAANATKETADLLNFVGHYYSGKEKNLEINVWQSQFANTREEMARSDAMNAESWWERFDWGSHGRVRQLMMDQVAFLRDLDRRLAVLHICCTREGFESTHEKAMKTVAKPLNEYVAVITELIYLCAISSVDGKFTAKESAELNRLQEVLAVKGKELGKTWADARRGHSIEKEYRTESFFILEVTSIARITAEFADKVDQSVNHVSKWVLIDTAKSVFSMEPIRNDKEFRNFVYRSTLAMCVGWWWCGLANNFTASVASNIIFMLTPRPGNALLLNLQKLQANVLGLLSGAALFRVFHYCDPIFKVGKLTALFFFSWLSMFIANYNPDVAVVGVLMAVFGAGKLMSVCEDHVQSGELAVAQSVDFKALKSFTFSMVIVTIVDSLLKREDASKQAEEKFLEGMETCFKTLEAFLQRTEYKEGQKFEVGAAVWEDTRVITSTVEAALSAARELADSAEQEPRFSKGKFKLKLYKDLCDRLMAAQLNIMTMLRRSLYRGTDLASGRVNVYDMLLKCSTWHKVQHDLLHTINTARKTVDKVLKYEGFGRMPISEIQDIVKESDLTTLENMEQLETDMKKQIDVNLDDPEYNMEWDRKSRLCAVFEMLETVTRDIAGITICCIDNI